MKKGLLGSTALVAATALAAGAAQAQEVKFSGFINFQAYVVDQDLPPTLGGVDVQQGSVHFGVDDAELHINVSGTADNGLEYGAKIEMEAVQSGTNNVDEARIQLGGTWGTLQFGDEDGAEDTMNYGGENVMGATGGFDGDQDDWYVNIGSATSFPNIAGDSSDSTKITYYSPRFSGFQVGASYTPQWGNQGDSGAIDSIYENHFGLGANYDNSFGDVRVRASAVYSMASVSDAGEAFLTQLGTPVEDIGAYSLGAIVGFGPVEVGVNWTDNDDSGEVVGSNDESSYWNAAVGFTSGPIYASLGYMASTWEDGGTGLEDEYTHLAVSVDYTVAPGLTAYAEYSSISSEIGGVTPSNDGSGFILGMNLSF